jgi:hypothetical protein
VEDKKVTNTRYGVKTTRNAVIADNTKAIKITFWQNCVDASEQEKIFRITNCITTSFNNEIWINTTSNSKITEIELFGEVKDSTNLLQASSSKIELALVSVTQHKKCSNVKCNKSITLDSSVPDQKLSSGNSPHGRTDDTHFYSPFDEALRDNKQTKQFTTVFSLNT